MDLTDKEKKFLEENFKAGEYCLLTMMINLKDLTKLQEVLTKANIKAVLIPKVKAEMDFYKDEEGVEN